MLKGWLERLGNHLPFKSQWHPISTAPYNQELEIRILVNEAIVTLEFPCLRTNDERWINVDLGTLVSAEPVQWRAWHHLKAPEPHHAKIKPADQPAIIRHRPVTLSEDDQNSGFG